MAGYVIPFPKFRAFDHNGDPLAGGKLYAFISGTSTPQNTWPTAALSPTPNAHPVVLDAFGEAMIFVPAGDLYTFVLKDSANVEQWTVDGVSVPEPEAPLTPGVLPTGTIVLYGGSSAPTGYLFCDGSAVSRATFAALFTILGTTYGAGDGSTTFNIPDMRQRFPLGKAASGTGSTLAATGGAIDHTHTGPSHSHGVGTLSAVASASATITGQSGTGFTAPSTTHVHGLTGSSEAGGTGATGTQNPPFQVVNYIIRTGN